MLFVWLEDGWWNDDKYFGVDWVCSGCCEFVRVRLIELDCFDLNCVVVGSNELCLLGDVCWLADLFSTLADMTIFGFIAIGKVKFGDWLEVLRICCGFVWFSVFDEVVVTSMSIFNLEGFGVLLKLAETKGDTALIRNK